jgi:hypothetical protein
LIDASEYFCLRGGSQFEGYPLPSFRLGFSWLSVNVRAEEEKEKLIRPDGWSMAKESTLGSRGNLSLVAMSALYI